MTRLTANAGSLALLRPEAAGDVAEDVLHLVAKDDEDHDHDHSDEDQDERVLDHALTLVAGDQLAEFFEEPMKLHI